MSHQDRNFKHDGPEARSMLQLLHLHPARSLINKMYQVEAGQIAGRIVKEHILRTGIARVDASALRAGMPFIDGGIEL